ncbi:hypothetical protein Btru_059328 [Bulinus truncatus]|nr:hypothetical protein Btru_059328 [Bulinus truncatus]
MSVTRQCFHKLILTAWTLYVISLILIIASVSTDSWLVRLSTGEHHGVFPCCPSFKCSAPDTFQAVPWEAFVAVFCLGFIVFFGGGVASVAYTWRTKTMGRVKWYYVIAVVIGLGGIILLVAVIIFATKFITRVSSTLKQYCFSTSDQDVHVGGSFVAFAIGTINIFFVSLTLFVATPRVRQPVMIGDIVEESGTEIGSASSMPMQRSSTNGGTEMSSVSFVSGQRSSPNGETEMRSASSMSRQQSSPNAAQNNSLVTTQTELDHRTEAHGLESSRTTDVHVDDRRGRQGRDLGVDTVCEVSNPESNLLNLHKLTPSAPDLDLISEKSASINVDFEQLNLGDPLSQVTHVNQSRCSQPIDRTETGHFIIPHPETSHFIIPHPETSGLVSSSSATNHAISKQADEIKQSDSSIYEQFEVEQAISEQCENTHSSSEQSAINHPISESSETEYATIEEMLSFVAQTESVYNNLPSVKPGGNISSSPTNDYMTYEELDIVQLQLAQREPRHSVSELCETNQSITELQIINSSNTNQIQLDYTTTEQQQSNQSMPEQLEEEYSTIEETLAKFVALNQSESVYSNLEYQKQDLVVSESADQLSELTSTGQLIFEDTQNLEPGYSNLAQQIANLSTSEMSETE